MEEKFELLNDFEVINVARESQIKIADSTCTVQEFCASIRQLAIELSRYSHSSINWSETKDGWFTEMGVEGSVLQFGEREWKSGRLKLAIAFCPDEPEPEIEDTHEQLLLEASIEAGDEQEESLDEIRQLAD